MNIHSRARSCPASRALMVSRVLEAGWPPSRAASAAGVSRRTVFKWLRRFRLEGPGGLMDRSSRPGLSPRRTSAEILQRTVELRRQRLPGLVIARKLRVSSSTVSRCLRKHRLSRMRDLDPKEPVIRYEKSRPGEMVHLDTKKLGRIDGVGHRIHGNRRCRSRGVGWEFAHVCVDDFSRVSYVEILEDERAETAAAFLARAASWFRGLGVRFEQVLTDNGGCYRSHVFRETLAELGAIARRTRPYRPRTNGKAERFIQTALREWAYARPYQSSRQRRSAVRPWLNFYNSRRPHQGIDGGRPLQRLKTAVNNVLTINI